MVRILWLRGPQITRNELLIAANIINPSFFRLRAWHQHFPEEQINGYHLRSIVTQIPEASSGESAITFAQVPSNT